jgi:hypothetical protein
LSQEATDFVEVGLFELASLDGVEAAPDAVWFVADEGVDEAFDADRAAAAGVTGFGSAFGVVHEVGLVGAAGLLMPGGVDEPLEEVAGQWRSAFRPDSVVGG